MLGPSLRRDLSRVFSVVFPALRAQGIGNSELKELLGMSPELLLS
jgi:hypothetical protein